MATIETERRMRMLATERGGQLIVDGVSVYSIKLARDGSLLIGPSASLVSVQALLATVDPKIVGAV